MEIKNSDTQTNAEVFPSIDLLGIITRHTGWLFLSCILGLIVGSTYYLLTPFKYESSAEILLMQNDSGAMATGVAGKERTVSEELLATHMKLIQSNRIIGAALERDGLIKLPSIESQVTPRQTAVQYVNEQLYVTSGGTGRAKNAHVLNIAFRHTSAEDAQKILSSIVSEYQSYIKARFQDVNIEAATLITKARRELDQEISDLEASYRQFRMSAPILAKGANGSDIYTMRYEELASERSHLTTKVDEQVGRLKLVKESLAEYKAANAPNIQKLSLIDEKNAERLGILVAVERGKADSQAFQSTQPERIASRSAEYSQLLSLKNQLKQLSMDFAPEHPSVRAVRQQIEETEEFLKSRSKNLLVSEDSLLTPDDVLNGYVSMLEHDLTALQQRIIDIEKQMDAAEEAAKKLVEFTLEDESLIRERTRREDLYNGVIERLRNINMQQDSSSLIQEIIEEPELGEKVEPRGTIAAVLSILSAAVIGLGGAIFMEFKDRSVRDPREFEELLSSKIIGQVPSFENDAELTKVLGKLQGEAAKIRPSLVCFHSPNSRASEGIRSLRTQVLFSLGGDRKVLSVSSANSGAGKSTIASNLSVSLAQSGKKVLLVDCDMRLPQVHEIFGEDNKFGLADAVENSDKLLSLVRGTPISNLSIMTSGVSKRNPAELLGSAEFKAIIESLREQYSYVILDCPPVLPVSDPAIIAPLSDGMLFVAIVNKQSRPETSNAKKILEGVGAKFIGIVMNRSERAAKYGYRSYGATYGYGYGYGANPYFEGAKESAK